MQKTEIIGYENGIAIVHAIPRRDAMGLQFYCQYCRRNHLHGTGLGHRVSHCFNRDSPFFARGYILSL